MYVCMYVCMYTLISGGPIGYVCMYVCMCVVEKIIINHLLGGPYSSGSGCDDRGLVDERFDDVMKGWSGTVPFLLERSRCQQQVLLK